MIEIDANDIVITEEEVGNYLADLGMIKQICVQFGADIASLLTQTNDLNALLELADKPSEHDIEKIKQLTYLNELLSSYKRTIDEADKAMSTLTDNSSEVHILRSSELSNIRISLASLFGEYTSALSMIITKKILNEQFIDTIKERLAFILCSNFEQLRSRFKCVIPDADKSETVH